MGEVAAPLLLDAEVLMRLDSLEPTPGAPLYTGRGLGRGLVEGVVEVKDDIEDWIGFSVNSDGWFPSDLEGDMSDGRVRRCTATRNVNVGHVPAI
jgi:hypothetical protein